MEEMTSRERIVAALDGRPVDHLPFSPFLAYVWEHFPPEIQAMGPLRFHQEIGADPMWRGTACPVAQTTAGVAYNVREDGDMVYTETVTPVGSVRLGHKRSVEGNTMFLVEHPLKAEEDYKVQMWIEENAKVSPADQAPVNDSLALEGLPIGMLIPRGKTAFQTMIEHLAGTEELIYALNDFPETVEALLQVMVENDLKAARMAVDCGYTHFLTFEDSSTQNYSPAMYRRYIMPEIAEYCRILGACGKKYVQHACGHLKGIMAAMKESGVHAVESISSPPTGNITMRETREILGSEVAVIGGIEPTHFLNLRMDELGPYAEQVISDLSGGPLVLANSDSCPPGVTMEKFKLVADIARRTSW